MILRRAPFQDFGELRPRLRLLLELHRAADNEEARLEIAQCFEEAFLAAAWHVAHDLLENGWEPTHAKPSVGRGHLKVVGGTD